MRARYWVFEILFFTFERYSLPDLQQCFGDRTSKRFIFILFLAEFLSAYVLFCLNVIGDCCF